MTFVATLKRHYCGPGGTVAPLLQYRRHRQQHRNVLDYLTEACDAASWGRQSPSPLPRRCATIAAQAALLHHYCGTGATGCGHWVESLSRYTLNGYQDFLTNF